MSVVEESHVIFVSVTYVQKHITLEKDWSQDAYGKNYVGVSK